LQIPWESVIAKYGLGVAILIAAALFLRREFEKNQAFLRERLAKADLSLDLQREASMALMNTSMKQMEEISRANRDAHAEEMKQMFEQLKVSNDVNQRIFKELERRK
jgi:hypothetical protein